MIASRQVGTTHQETTLSGSYGEPEEQTLGSPKELRFKVSPVECEFSAKNAGRRDPTASRGLP